MWQTRCVWRCKSIYGCVTTGWSGKRDEGGRFIMQSVPMKMVCAYFRALQSTKVLLCPFHCEVEKRIGSCTLEFISVPPVLASCCRIKKHHKVGIPVPVGSSIGSRPTIPTDHPRLCVPFGEPSLLSLCPSLWSRCFDVYACRLVDRQNETNLLERRSPLPRYDSALIILLLVVCIQRD